MAEFENPPIQLDVQIGNENVGALAAFPRTLQISVSDARQDFPTQSASVNVNTALLFAGLARFGQDQFPHPTEPGPLVSNDDDNGAFEDAQNRFDGTLEVDHGDHKTLYLQLRLQQQQFQKAVVVGSASLAALASAGLNTEDVFGAATDNTKIDLTDTDPKGQQTLQKDFWLFSDVFAEDGSQLNRLGYQATALLQTGSLAIPTSKEVTGE
jgi:hypothetical protein